MESERVNCLIINDNPSVAIPLNRILSEENYEVVLARSGYEGLDHACKRRFDITITELHLPDVSGLDMLGEIKERDPDSTVFILVADHSPELVWELLGRGADGVLNTPFFISHLLALIKKALSRRCG